jgi:hypothetical protein
MAPGSRLDRQIREIILCLDRLGAATTLLGGLALALALAPYLEGLSAFKLRGFVNDPRRTRDLGHIRALLRANRDRVDLAAVREYFRLFDQVPLLDHPRQPRLSHWSPGPRSFRQATVIDGWLRHRRLTRSRRSTN